MDDRLTTALRTSRTWMRHARTTDHRASFYHSIATRWSGGRGEGGGSEEGGRRQRPDLGQDNAKSLHPACFSPGLLGLHFRAAG